MLANVIILLIIGLLAAMFIFFKVRKSFTKGCCGSSCGSCSKGCGKSQ